MADETDFDMDMDLDREALDRVLSPEEGLLAGAPGSRVAPLHDGPMGPGLIEALPSSPGRPSESYDPDLPNWAVEGSNAKRLPGDGLACVNCPEAVWMTGGEDLEAFCRVLRTITWSTGEAAPMQIEICTGKEMAIIALLERQTHRELKDHQGSSR